MVDVEVNVVMVDVGVEVVMVDVGVGVVMVDVGIDVVVVDVGLKWSWLMGLKWPSLMWSWLISVYMIACKRVCLLCLCLCMFCVQYEFTICILQCKIFTLRSN